MRTYKITIISLFFSLTIWCAQEKNELILCASVPLPTEISTKIIEKNEHDTIEMIGRLGQTCRANNEWYRNFVGCADPSDNNCSSRKCTFLFNNIDACTQALAWCAKEYAKDPDKHKQAKTIFEHLWRHHKDGRRTAVSDVMKIPTPSWDDCLTMYAGKYLEQEMEIAQLIAHHAHNMKLSLEKSISWDLKRFFLKGNILAVKTMLLTHNLLFDPSWSGYKKDYFFSGKREYTLFDFACELNDSSIMKQLMERSPKNCYKAVVKSMIYFYRVNMLASFITQNSARESRFYMWHKALGSKSVDNPELDCNQLELKIFETIIDNLFPGQAIYEKDGDGRALFFHAIKANNVNAVKFLLEKKKKLETIVEPDITGHNGHSLLYCAYDKPDIISLLLEYGTNINQRNDDGKTALMAAASDYLSNRLTKKVIELLVGAGADIHAVDNCGQSVLHHYARANDSEMIEFFINHGVEANMVDQYGKTPSEYAKNFKIIQLFSPSGGIIRESEYSPSSSDSMD